MLLESTACLDWEERIVAGDSLIPFSPLFPAEAEEALSIFDKLRMMDVADSPMLGEISREFIRDFVAQIFGAYDPDAGRRLIQDFYLLISKKNGKSSIAAGIMITALILNWRISAEFLILSPTKEIADNSFKPAADMVENDDELRKLLQVQHHTRTITHRITRATLKVIAADAETVGGKKAVGVLVDEHWLFGKRANAEGMFREALGGLASRPEGFVIYLTTQSDDPPAGVFKAKLEYARKVRDGLIVDPRFLPVLYEFPQYMVENESYLLPENFYVTNPNLIYADHPEYGGSVDCEYLQREMSLAAEAGEDALRGFLAKHLNVEIGMNLRSDRWPGAEFWIDGTHSSPITLDRILEECEVVDVGIDGGGLDDLLGLAVIGRTRAYHDVVIETYYDETDDTYKPLPEPITRSVQLWMLWNYAWAHPSVLKRRKDIAPRLKDFATAKNMTLVKFIGQDMDELAQIVAKIEDAGLLDLVGLDPAAIGGVLDAILQAGVPEDKMKAVTQGWRLAAPIKTAERKVAEGVLVHEGSAMMAWCVGNAKVKVVGNAIVITKQVSGTAKIDPLMATFNAVSLMQLNPPAQIGTYNFDNMVIGG